MISIKNALNWYILPILKIYYWLRILKFSILIAYQLNNYSIFSYEYNLKINMKKKQTNNFSEDLNWRIENLPYNKILKI